MVASCRRPNRKRGILVKKLLVMFGTFVVTVSMVVVPVFANVVRPSGQTTGQPSASESNTGSTQGIANRSSTGTQNKTTHDGYRDIL